MKTLRFEPLTTRHIPEILHIEAKTQTAPWSEQAFHNELANPQSYFLVALAEGKVAGYGGFWRCIDEAHITTVSVNPDLQRQGIARKLMKELLEKAREEGFVCSTLEVRAGNEPAIKLYEMLGYQTTARRKSYYPDNKEDALVMWLYDLQEATFAR
jgi:ribosomal-protein-alanine N-acetyltransferase